MENPYVNPRLSIIEGVSNREELFYSISKRNTNLDSFYLFMGQLRKHLDRLYQNWQADTVILLDGAKYHISIKMQIKLKEMGFSLIYSEPYSYDAAPCELFFS